MPNINLQCQNCRKIFFSGITMAPGASATFINNKSTCPHCGSMENIPDGTFKATLEGFVNILQQSSDPLNEARALLSELKKAKDESDLREIKKSTAFSKYSTWLPNNLQNIASYAAIVSAIIGILMFMRTSRPQNTEINLNTVINQEYNQIIETYNINITNYQK